MIGTEEDLRARFGEVHPLAIAKTRPSLDKYSRQFIAMSPFVVVSTADATGKADLSPRGDPPGFVHVVDVIEGAFLNGLNNLPHLGGGGHGLFGQFTDFVGHDREPPAGVAGPGRFDGGV